jgi:hypothetical protein
MSDHRPPPVLDLPFEIRFHHRHDSSIFMRLSEMPEIPGPAAQLGSRRSGGIRVQAYERMAFVIEENLESFLDQIGEGA